MSCSKVEVSESKSSGVADIWDFSFPEMCKEIGASLLQKILSSFGLKSSASSMLRVGAIGIGLANFISGIFLARKLSPATTGACKYILYINPILSVSNVIMDIISLVCEFGVSVSEMFRAPDLSVVFDRVSDMASTLTGALSSETEEAIELQELISLKGEGTSDTSGQSASGISPNALSPTHIVGIVTSIISVLLVAGASFIGWNLTEINNFLRCQHQTSSLATDMKTCIVGALETLGICDTTGQASLVQEAEDILAMCHNLRKLKEADFILNSSHFNSLQTTHDRIAAIQIKALQPSVKKILTGSLQKLDSEYKYLSSILADLRTLLDDIERQVTVPLVLEGDAGIGKSTLANYLLKQVGEIFSYGTEIYDLSRGSSGRFNKPYAYQSLGIFNELGAQRAEDMNYLGDINKLNSGDPFGFESAGEKQKYQPCMLKFIVYTSNTSRYNFEKKLTDQAVLAMFSRFTRVQVQDVLYDGDRHAVQSHRDKNFTHLSCQFVKPKTIPTTKVSDLWDMEGAPTNVHDLLCTMVRTIADRELEYIVRIRDKYASKPDMLATLDARVIQLETIKTNHTSPPLLFKLPFVSFVNGGTTTTRRPHHPLGDSSLSSSATSVIYIPSTARPNATDPAVMHVAGPPGVGKTTRCLSLLNRISRVYAMPVVVWKHGVPLSSITRKERALYLIDDYPFVLPGTTSAYLSFINSIAQGSLVVITTNRPFNIVNYDWKFLSYYYNTIVTKLAGSPPSHTRIAIADPYWPDIINQEPGLIRRIGMDVRCHFSNVLPRPSQKYFEFDHLGVVKGSDGIAVPNFEETALAFCEATLFKPVDLIVKFDTVHVVDADIVMDVQDLPKFCKDATSTSGLLKLASGRSSGGSISFDRGALALKAPASFLGDWLVPEIPEGVDVVDMAKIFCNRIRLVTPEVTLRVRFGSMILYYRNGVLTVQTQEAESPVTVENGLMKVNGNVFSTMDFGVFMASPSAFLELHPSKYTFLELEAIKTYYSKNKVDLDPYTNAIKLYSSKLHQYKNLKTFGSGCLWVCSKFKSIILWLLSDSSILFWKIVGCIVGVVSAIKFGAWFFKNDKPIEQKPNSEESNREYKMTARQENRSKHIPHREKAWTVANATENVVESAFNTKEPKVIAAVLSTIPQADIKPIVDSIFSNAVHPSLIRKQIDTPISAAIIKIKKNLFKFVGSAHCYGIFIKDNIAIVPLHAVDLESSRPDANVVVWSPDEETRPSSYNCVVKQYTTRKDLAVLVVEKIPPQKDITSLLPTAYLETYSDVACYVRPFKTIEISWGTAIYSAAKCVPLGDTEDFHPIDYIYFDQVQFEAKHIYQRGDCGLPLLALRDNQVYLLGIHIALSKNDEGWFSPLLASELRGEASATPNAIEDLHQSVVKGFEECTDVPAWNPVFEKLEQTDIWSNHPEIPVLGETKTGFNIAPTSDKKCIWNDSCEFPLETAPAPTRLDMLTETAKDTLPKDFKGISRVLLAQTKKYFAMKEFKPEKEAFDLAVDYTQFTLQQFCGINNKPLRTHAVINGEWNTALKRMTMTSSAGPHLKMLYNVQNKEDIFQQIPNEGGVVYGWRSTAAATRAAVDYKNILESWSRRRPVVLVIKDNPKVEILPQVDVEVGKVRQFCEMDLSLNMALRRYFGSFFEKLGSTSLESPFKIGWNPYLFPFYIHQLENPDFDLICIDVKRMDKNLHSTFVRNLCRFCNSCQEEPCSDDFNAIADTMSKAIHFQGRVCYTQEHGNHSGSYLTTPLNTISVYTCALYAFIKRFKEVKGSYPSFRICSTWFTSSGVGDDARFRFHPILKMNFAYLEQCFSECGLEIVENKNSGESTILGELCSRFFFHDKKYNCIFPALKKISIIKSLHWIKKSKIKIFPEICSIALFEASMWDKAFFEKVLKEVTRQIKRLKLSMGQVSYTTYEAYRKHFSQYVRGQQSSPVVTSTGNDYFERLLTETIYTSEDLKEFNAISAYYNRFGDNNRPVETSSFNKEAGKWEWRISHQGCTSVGRDAKAEFARRRAFANLFSQQLSKLPKPDIRE